MTSGGSNFNDFPGLKTFCDTEVKNSHLTFSFRGVSDTPSHPFIILGASTDSWHPCRPTRVPDKFNKICPWREFRHLRRDGKLSNYYCLLPDWVLYTQLHCNCKL